MIPLPESIAPDDIQQWLHDCIFVDPEGLPYMYIALTSGPTGLCLIRGASFKPGPLKSKEVTFSPDDVYVHWPPLGAVNVDNRALYVQRAQSRQYRRSYCHRLVQIHAPGAWHVVAGGGDVGNRYTGNSAALVRELFNPEYPADFSSALSMLGGKTASVALNRHIILVGNAEAATIYHGRDVVGAYKEGMVRLLPEVGGPSRIRKLIGGMDYVSL